MDKLEEIFKMQEQLDAYIIGKRNCFAGNTPEERIQKKCLALLDETAELLNEVNYKWWKNPKPVNIGNVQEELIDMLHFWVSMCLDAGLTPDKIHEVYLRKNKENLNRQDGTSIKSGYNINEENN